MSTNETPFLIFWRQTNVHLERAGSFEIGFGDARYWFEASVSPDTAARLVIEERRREVEESEYAAIKSK
jgi:hypothetical protein